jgi:hypothetical protein
MLDYSSHLFSFTLLEYLRAKLELTRVETLMGIHSVSLYVRVFITLSHVYLSLIFTGKAGAYPSGDPYKALHYKTFYSSDFGRNVIS